jgi:hypothetical protein
LPGLLNGRFSLNPFAESLFPQLFFLDASYRSVYKNIALVARKGWKDEKS